MEICTFWYGPELRTVDALCLKSMLAARYRVSLYAHAPVNNLPDGVDLRDAAEVLPLDFMARLDPNFPKLRSHVSIQQYSDIFRMALMQKERGIWFDTDVYVLKHREFNPAIPYFARENRRRVGVSVLYFPKGHFVLNKFEAYRHSNALIPEWLGFRKRILRPAVQKIRTGKVFLPEIGTTIFGNDGVSRLLKQSGEFGNAAAKSEYYQLTGDETASLYDARFDWSTLLEKDVFGIHMHRKGPSISPPVSGSFYQWASDKFGQ